MLSDRRQRVLAALIEEYVSQAIPVGSRTLVEKHHLGVSPATVRNELSVLESEGYIAQPHTSAGRIPTDIGYRSFVDDLLSREFSEEAADEEVRKAARTLRESASELDQLIEQTTAAMARITDCLSIVVAPTSASMRIKQVNFVLLDAHLVLVVVVTDDGQVLNRSIEVSDEVRADDLAHAQSVIMSLADGCEVGDFSRVTLAHAERLNTPLLNALVEEVSACLKQGEAQRAHRLGLSTLMRQPEFSHSQALIPVMQMLEDDTVLLQLLDQTGALPDAAHGTMVRIGHENNSENLSGVSVVAARYGRKASEGVVAVIGPTRMDYAQVIRAVRTARGALQDE